MFPVSSFTLGLFFIRSWRSWVHGLDPMIKNSDCVSVHLVPQKKLTRWTFSETLRVYSKVYSKRSLLLHPTTTRYPILAVLTQVGREMGFEKKHSGFPCMALRLTHGRVGSGSTRRADEWASGVLCRHDRDGVFPGTQWFIFLQLLVLDSRGYSKEVMLLGPPDARENVVSGGGVCVTSAR